MVHTTSLRKIGNSTGLTLPKATLDRLGMKAGTKVFTRDTPEGILVTPYDPEFAAAMEAYEEISHRYRNALRELAK